GGGHLSRHHPYRGEFGAGHSGTRFRTYFFHVPGDVMSRTTLDIWVGIFVLVGIGALFFLALRVGNVSSVDLTDAYTVRGQFDNIGGLKVRAPVKSAGVVVGRVNDIRFDTNSYRAVVEMSIAREFEFPRDTIASILTSGLLGEQYI